MSRYDQALSDWQYLWEVYGPAADMTGGYVDQNDLLKLLKSPTKKTATGCLESQIIHWFQAGPELGSNSPDPEDKRLQKIAADYGYSHLYPSSDDDDPEDETSIAERYGFGLQEDGKDVG